jgi:hypothetical protein
MMTNDAPPPLRRAPPSQRHSAVFDSHPRTKGAAAMSLDHIFAAAPRRHVADHIGVVPPLPHDRPSTRFATGKITAALIAAFSLTAAAVAAEIRRRRKLERQYRLDNITDDDQIERQADQVAKDIDLSPLHAIVPVVGFALGAVAINQISQMLGRLGDFAAIGPDAERIARDLARSRAAELVGMRYDNAGDLVPNPDAKWAITDTTRNILREIIATGIEQGQSVDQIADAISGATAFSQARARTVAVTEVTTIDGRSALASFKLANAKGRKLRKSWICGGDNPCEYCLANQDDGDIDLDDEFSGTGDLAPPAHVGCFCFIAAVGDD